MNHEGYCRDCQAPVYWLASRPGNRLTPVNREPVPDGNCVIDLTTGTWRVAKAEERHVDGGPHILHVTHFTTCPAADTRRRR